MAFKPGDVVRLKSGSPAMTISKIGHVGTEEVAVCIWFEKNQRKSGNFSLVSLVLDEGGGGPVIV